ncbi:MAG: tRNA (N6-threonylcarbamoyladenosine(37)-N6)-methyltransferase TrmO [Desulfamplus sp.]|nr:tRNA (N6-threonylcarbamoyladenosine(37)-N6)-methyltransferase TrmO [Desulfamplus sp.]
MESIGVIRTCFKEITNMPIQPRGAADVQGNVIIKEKYMAGLKDLDGFSHIYLIYLFHKAQRTELTVTPFLDTVERGVFATRSPLRPNHIGLSIVEVVKIKGTEITVRGADVLDETPLLDIKPYIKNFDGVSDSTSGWMKADSEEVGHKRSDGRFK